MKQVSKKKICIGAGLLASFVVWTVLLHVLDVRAIGPLGSSVGFSTVNEYVHTLTGVHMSIYTVTDWLGLVPLGAVFAFAVLGLCQWIKRRSIFKVDVDLLFLGGFYLAVMAVYLLFETVVINYRPILIEGRLEVSYPSSTTMLVLCVMPTVVMQCRARIRSRLLRRCATVALCAFSCFMVVGRLISGVHWFTDIFGGLLLSAGLVVLYSAVANIRPNRADER